MKIRHKQTTDAQWEVLNPDEFYLARIDHQLVALPKSDYEPVPETRWEDITRDVQVDEGGRGLHVSQMWGGATLPDGYRFVKKKLGLNLAIERKVNS